MSGDGHGQPDTAIPRWLRPFAVVVAMAALMWAVEVVDLVPGTDIDQWGIRPRQLRGLVGIVAAPFLHGGFGHLIGNTIPFLVLGALIAVGGMVRYLEVTAVVVVVAGLGTWLVGPARTDHIGASGVVFGYLTYLLARGVYERKLGHLVIGAIVLFLFGGVLWGLVPRTGISWQGHLFGALGGVAAARLQHGGPREPTGRSEPAAA